MEYTRVHEAVASFLNHQSSRCAVAGGWGLNSYGGGRTTFDLDLIVPFDQQDAVVAYLESLGYETLHRSSGYSNHLHADPAWGRVDLIYVRGETEAKLFADARERLVFPGCKALVPKPEHLIAMKVTAYRNDRTRRLQDLADIRVLLRIESVDRDEVREYFHRHGLDKDYEEIHRSL